MMEEINVKELVEENIALKKENEELKKVIGDIRQKLSNVIIGHTAKRDLYNHMS